MVEEARAIVEARERGVVLRLHGGLDLRDVLTLLKDLEIADDEAPGVIGLRYLAARCARDWGLHHDVERNLDRAEALASAGPSPNRQPRPAPSGSPNLESPPETAAFRA